MIKLAVIYDTSYLMAERSSVFEVSAASARAHIEVLHFVPIEVQLEIARHIANKDDQRRNEAARAARALYARIIGKVGFNEISLDGLPIPEMHERILGPDSEVDKLLIALAYQIIEDATASVVFISTRDAGIGAEIAHQCTRNGRPVYCDLVMEQFNAKLCDLSDFGSCPHGHGALRDWRGKPHCWTCGWPSPSGKLH